MRDLLVMCPDDHPLGHVYRPIEGTSLVAMDADTHRRVHAGEDPHPQDERPVHRPAAPDAPIPGRHCFSSCDPDRPRVREDGKCEGCGARACPACGSGWLDARGPTCLDCGWEA